MASGSDTFVQPRDVTWRSEGVSGLLSGDAGVDERRPQPVDALDSLRDHDERARLPGARQTYCSRELASKTGLMAVELTRLE